MIAYNRRCARVVKLVDTADLKSAGASPRRAGSIPALGTTLRPRLAVRNRYRRAASLREAIRRGASLASRLTNAASIGTVNGAL